MAFIGKSAVSPARFRLVAQQLVPTLNYPSLEIRRAARNGINPVFFHSTKKGPAQAVPQLLYPAPQPPSGFFIGKKPPCESLDRAFELWNRFFSPACLQKK
jgi:hypothetical protein